MPEEKPFDVFLSHNSLDKPAVEYLARRLEDEAKLKPWLDKWNLIPGEPWQEALEQALNDSRTCAVFIGPSGIGPWENEEMRSALDTRLNQIGFRVIPVLLPGASLPGRGKLPRFLSRLTWVDFRAGLDDSEAFRRLVAGILGVAPGPHDKSTPSVLIIECPYRGLEVFDEAHERFFFGREAMSQHLIEALSATPFLAVLGPSGSGKSSLVRAGLIPKLKKGALPLSEQWIYLSFRPGAHPLQELAICIARAKGDDNLLAILNDLEADERSLHLQARFLLTGRAKGLRLLILVDQFEELLALCDDEDERVGFINNIRYASTVAEGQTTIVITMRADFLARAAEYADLAEILSGNQFIVSRMDDVDLRRAIEEPARLVGLSFERGLVERILKDVGHEPGVLPLLEDTLLQLFEKRRSDNVMIAQEYDESGGIHEALAKRAGKVFAGLTPEQQVIGRRILLELTQFGEDTEDTRRRVRISELWREPTERPSVEEVIGILTNARLLTTSMDGRGQRQLDVAHEALIRGWPDLRKWIDEQRLALRMHRRVTEAAQEWEGENEDTSFLYRGARLAQAREWLEINEVPLNQLEQKFLNASKAAEQQERRAAQRHIAMNLSSLIIIAVLFGYYVITGVPPNKEISPNELEESAFLQLSTDPDMSLSFALEALRKSPTEQAEASLKQALTQSQMRRVFGRSKDLVLRAVFSSGGKQVVTTSYDGTAGIWNAATRQQVSTLVGHKDIINSSAFSSDGSRVVTASVDGTARIWNAATGRMERELSGHKGVVISAVFSPDGRYVLTASADGTAGIWNAATGAMERVLGDSKGIVYRALFSPDGYCVLTMSYDGPAGELITARIWDAKTGKIKRVLCGHKGIVISAAFSADGTRVVTTSHDKTARVWDAATGNIVCTTRGHETIMNSAVFSPDGKHVLTAGYDGKARIWDAKTGEMERELSGHKCIVNSAVFSPDGYCVLTTSDDATVRIWDATTGKQIRSFLNGRKSPRDQVTGQIPEEAEDEIIMISAAFSDDGTRVVIAGRNKGKKISVWDIATGEPVYGSWQKNVNHRFIV